MTTEPEEQEQAAAAPLDPDKRKELEEKIVNLLKTCYDPEIPVDIYELGLIYDIGVKSEDTVHIKMTLTSPMCPVAESLPPEVERKVKTLPEIQTAKVDVVWDPPWAPTMMSEAAKLQLNMM